MNINNNELSKLTKLSKLTTKYLIEVDRNVWEAFKLISISQGQKVKDAIQQAIIEYIENHKTESQKIEIQIIENKEAKTNILQVIIEEEIRGILKELMDAKQRKTNITYINELKKQLFEILKKNSSVSKDLAEEIKIVLQTLRT
jgi:transketolase